MATDLSDRFAGLALMGEPGFVCRESTDSDVYRTSIDPGRSTPVINDQPRNSLTDSNKPSAPVITVLAPKALT
jgi:hypothetical protein